MKNTNRLNNRMMCRTSRQLMIKDLTNGRAMIYNPLGLAKHVVTNRKEAETLVKKWGFSQG